jgi:hypothetical protein
MPTDTWTLVSTVWTPSAAILGTHNEGDPISYTISCIATYEQAAIPPALPATKTVNCSITIVPEKIRDTLVLGDGSITGTLVDVFNRSITYMTKDRQYVTVDGYSKIDNGNLYKMISVVPSSSSSENFNFTCTAVEVPETKTYTIVIQNNWDGDKNSLKSYVAETESLGLGDLS